MTGGVREQGAGKNIWTQEGYNKDTADHCTMTSFTACAPHHIINYRYAVSHNS